MVLFKHERCHLICNPSFLKAAPFTSLSRPARHTSTSLSSGLQAQRSPMPSQRSSSIAFPHLDRSQSRCTQNHGRHITHPAADVQLALCHLDIQVSLPSCHASDVWGTPLFLNRQHLDNQHCKNMRHSLLDTGRWQTHLQRWALCL